MTISVPQQYFWDFLWHEHHVQKKACKDWKQESSVAFIFHTSIRLQNFEHCNTDWHVHRIFLTFDIPNTHRNRLDAELVQRPLGILMYTWYTYCQGSQQQWGQSSACGMIAAYTPPRVPAPGGNSRYFGPPYLTGAKRLIKKKVSLLKKHHVGDRVTLSPGLNQDSQSLMS